jgi:hypothetical protein
MSDHIDVTRPSFPMLRQLLTKPASSECWRQLREMFDHWPGGEDKLVARDYAEAHLATWDDSLRVLYKVDFLDPVWSLAKTLNVSNQSAPLYTMENLDDIAPPIHIRRLHIRYVDWLKLSASSLRKFSHIEHLTLSHCIRQDTLSFEDIELPQLKSLTLLQCDDVTRVFGLAQFPNLRSLKMTRLLRLKSLRFLAQLSTLEELKLTSCIRLQDFSPISAHPELQRLHIGGLDEANDLKELRKLTELRSLFVSDCKFVRDFSFLHPLKKLEELELCGAHRISSFDVEQHLPELRTLIVRDNPWLATRELKSDSLEIVYFSWLWSLKELTLDSLPRLKKLTLKCAPRLQKKDITLKQAPAALASLNLWGGPEGQGLSVSLESQKEVQNFLRKLPQNSFDF